MEKSAILEMYRGLTGDFQSVPMSEEVGKAAEILDDATEKCVKE